MAMSKVLERCNIDKLQDFQKDAIDAILQDMDTFVATRTGSGKSLIYEIFPVLRPESTVLIIAPLRAIMKEQTDKLCSRKFKATYIGKDESEDDGILEGKFEFVFTNPETIFGVDRQSKWMKILAKLKLIVMDEAHTVIQWRKATSRKPCGTCRHSGCLTLLTKPRSITTSGGYVAQVKNSVQYRGQGRDKEEAFRKLFGNIGELRSLCINVPMLALTATSSPSQRRKIMKSLCFRQNSKVISESPDRQNIKISTLCIPNNDILEETFTWLLEDLKVKQKQLPRHVIFCESISTVAHIYSMFRKTFSAACNLFDMYHSKTTDNVKEKIRSDMRIDGNIRVLICTNSAGMGVNFYGVHNIIHYGLPREMDTLVQQMGRAGRDGENSNELIIYKFHRGHFKFVDDDLVRLVKDNQCRRKILCESYVCKKEDILPKHNCCDFCHKQCKCGDCPAPHPAYAKPSEEKESEENLHFRTVTNEDKMTARHKLQSLKRRMCESSTIIDPELTHGFNDNAINCIIRNLEILFTPNDIMKHVTIWSYEIAVQISEILNDVFGENYMFENSDDSLSESDM